jgi:hypothetical protein
MTAEVHNDGGGAHNLSSSWLGNNVFLRHCNRYLNFIIMDASIAVERRQKNNYWNIIVILNTYSFC